MAFDVGYEYAQLHELTTAVVEEEGPFAAWQLEAEGLVVIGGYTPNHVFRAPAALLQARDAEGNETIGVASFDLLQTAGRAVAYYLFATRDPQANVTVRLGNVDFLTGDFDSVDTMIAIYSDPDLGSSDIVREPEPGAEGENPVPARAIRNWINTLAHFELASIIGSPPPK